MIDIGANLTNNVFEKDYQAVLQRAKASGLTHIIITGTNFEVSRKALTLCNDQPNFLFSTCGCHPHDASEFKRIHLDSFRELLKHKNVKAIGECGLDFNRNYSPPQVQVEVFVKQLELACETKMPVFLHQRDAHKQFLEILKTYRQDLGRIVVHCFTDGKEELVDYLELDCYIGITGWLCDEKRGVALRQVVTDIPENRIMIETDAPYLLPRNVSKKIMKIKPVGRRNEPAFLPVILENLAELRQQDPQQLEEVIINNSKSFFSLN